MTLTRVPLRVITSALVFLVAALTAYYGTVYGIRLTVNEKADRATVEQIDHRLIAIETLLRADVAHRNDLDLIREEMRTRLTRIETLLEQPRRISQ